MCAWGTLVRGELGYYICFAGALVLLYPQSSLPIFFSFPTSTCCIFDFVDRYSHALGLFSANTSLVLPRFVVFGFSRYNPFIMHLDIFLKRDYAFIESTGTQA